MAARLGFGFISNHPFVDGNKRIGLYVMLSFLQINGIIISFTDDEIEQIAVGIASGAINYVDLKRILEQKIDN